MKFSEKIIQARKVKALTQEDLAEAVGVSRQAVSKWETDEAKPDLDKLVALCNVLELSMDYLCLDREPEKAEQMEGVQQKNGGLRHLLLGACLGMVVALLIGLFVWILPGETSEQMPEAGNKQAYSEMLEMTINSAKVEKLEGGSILRVRFSTSVQVPDMQVQIALKDYRNNTVQYLDVEQQNTEYICDIPSDGIVWLDVTAVCTLGEVIVRMPIVKIQSHGYNDYQVTDWWQ